VVAGTVSIAISSTLPAATDWWNDLAVDGVATGLTDAGHYLQITWNSNTVDNGTHTLTVRGHQENTGNITAISSVTVTVGNSAPTPTPTLTPTLTPTPTPVPSFQVSSPVAGATVSGAIAISVVTSLSLAQDWWNDLLVDGVGTGLTDAGHYQQINWNSASVGNGSHTLTVRAHQETSGVINASASVTINTNNGSPTPTPSPSFKISAPPAGGTVSGSAVAITVATNLSLPQDWWNDLLVDGAVTGLTDTGHYQQINWNSATVANGAHTLTVRAHQETSNTVNAKASVSIKVTN